MTILTREHIEDFGLYPPSPMRDLLDTARAYHDLRDAVLALHSNVEFIAGAGIACRECMDAPPCATARTVESVGGEQT